MKKIINKKANVGFDRIMLYGVIIIALAAILFGIFQLSPTLRQAIGSLPDYGTPDGEDIKLTPDELAEQSVCEVTVGVFSGLSNPSLFETLANVLPGIQYGDVREIFVCKNLEKCNDLKNSLLVYSEKEDDKRIFFQKELVGTVTENFVHLRIDYDKFLESFEGKVSLEDLRKIDGAKISEIYLCKTRERIEEDESNINVVYEELKKSGESNSFDFVFTKWNNDLVSVNWDFVKEAPEVFIRPNGNQQYLIVKENYDKQFSNIANDVHEDDLEIIEDIIGKETISELTLYLAGLVQNEGVSFDVKLQSLNQKAVTEIMFGVSEIPE